MTILERVSKLGRGEVLRRAGPRRPSRLPSGPTHGSGPRGPIGRPAPCCGGEESRSGPRWPPARSGAPSDRSPLSRAGPGGCCGRRGRGRRARTRGSRKPEKRLRESIPLAPAGSKPGAWVESTLDSPFHVADAAHAACREITPRLSLDHRPSAESWEVFLVDRVWGPIRLPPSATDCLSDSRWRFRLPR